MARTDAFNDDIDTDGDSTVTAPGTESAPTPTEPTTAATEPTAEEKAQALADAETEFQPAVDAFAEVAETAVEHADVSTQTIPEADLQAVTKAYREVKGGIKFKNRAKDYLSDQMKEALQSGPEGFNRAAAFNKIAQHLSEQTAQRATSGGGERTPKAPANPNEAYATILSGFEAALRHQEANLPEGVTNEGLEPFYLDTEATAALDNEIEGYLEWREDQDFDPEKDDAADRPERFGEDEPTLSPAARAAVKLISVKVSRKSRSTGGTGYSGPRRSVAAHIESAFADLAPGTFLKINDIAQHSSAEYGDDHPSSGAINAALWPRSGKPTEVKGVTPTEAAVGDKTVKGAIKS